MHNDDIRRIPHCFRCGEGFWTTGDLDEHCKVETESEIIEWGDVLRVHGPHGHQGLVWAAIWPALILWHHPQGQCSPHSSPHKSLMAMTLLPLHKVSPLTQLVWGQSVMAVCPPT